MSLVGHLIIGPPRCRPLTRGKTPLSKSIDLLKGRARLLRRVVQVLGSDDGQAARGEDLTTLLDVGALETDHQRDLDADLRGGGCLGEGVEGRVQGGRGVRKVGEEGVKKGSQGEFVS